MDLMIIDDTRLQIDVTGTRIQITTQAVLSDGIVRSCVDLHSPFTSSVIDVSYAELYTRVEEKGEDLYPQALEIYILFTGRVMMTK